MAGLQFSGRSAVAVIAILLGTASMAGCGRKADANAAVKIAALRELRDSGVISAADYDAQVAKLGAAAAGGGSAPAASLLTISNRGGREQHSIEDPQLGITVTQIETPAGWRVQGEAAHGQGGCASMPDSTHYVAEAPDGLYATSLEGVVKYGQTTAPQFNAAMRQQGCVIFGSPAAEEFLKAVWIPQMRRGARIESAEPLPETDDMVQMGRQQAAQMQQSTGGQLQMQVHGGRVRIAYDVNGQPVEEDVKAVTFCQTQQQAMPMGPAIQVLDCSGPVTTVRAPAGKLDDFAARSAQVVKVTDNPDYGQRLNQVIAQRGTAERETIARNGEATLARGRQENAARLATIVANGQAGVDRVHAIGGASMAAARQSSDALHASASAFARHMGDNANYAMPGGGTFNASNQYAHTYVGPNNHVLQTDSPYGPPAGYTEVQGR